MEKLSQFGYPFVLVIDKLKEAQKYHDMGIAVMFGSIEDPETFQSAGINNAAMVVATDDDIRNVNVAFGHAMLPLASPLWAPAITQALRISFN